MKALCVLFCMVLLAGCRGRGVEESPAPADDGTRSAVQTVIEGATGKTAVRHRQNARARIDAAAARRNRDIEDAME